MAADRKNKQWVVALGLGGCLLAAVGFMAVVMNSSEQVALAGVSEPAGLDIDIISDRRSSAAPEQSWITNSRVEIDRLASVVESLERSIEGERAGFRQAIDQQDEKYEEFLTQQATRIAELELQIASGPVRAENTGPGGRARNPLLGEENPAETPVGFDTDFAATGSEFIQRQPLGGVSRPAGTTRVAPAGVDENGVPFAGSSFGQNFTLTEVAAEEVTLNNVRNYLPPGSYAPAVVLSGADAATNVSDREDPVPVLFRVTGEAVTAAAGGGRGHKVDIEGCIVQGAAIGDLSSERVRVRLLSMTCTNRFGLVHESSVTGYMVGAGKAGVRGQVVSREGNLVTNAAIAGALNGLAGSAGGVGTEEDADISELIQSAGRSAVSGGVGQAASTLSEYYIKRAEQYQPVISLNGGSRVELVFMEGVSLE